MKKIISVLLCIALMFTFMTVFAAAEGDGDSSGAETIFSVLLGLLEHVDWTSILSVLAATLETLGRMFGLS